MPEDPNILDLRESSQKGYIEKQGDLISKRARTVSKIGEAEVVGGQAVRAAGKTLQTSGKVVGAIGRGTSVVGKELSSTEYGAIVGKPLELVGKGTQMAGRGMESAGSTIKAGGTEMRTAGAELTAKAKLAGKAGPVVSALGKNFDIATNVKKSSKILGYGTTFLMIGTALIFDAIKAILNATVVGDILLPVVTIFGILTFYFWFRIKGQNMATPKRLWRMAAGGITDIIPIVSSLPTWTATVISLMGTLESKKSETEKK